MFQSLTEKIIVGVVSAIALGAIFAAWDAIKSAGGDVFIPRGAVVAFDFGPNETAKCPKGWKGHREARGRMVIGSGKHSNKAENGEALKAYEVGQAGGVSEHTLEPHQMPKHSHNLQAIVGLRPAPPATPDNFIFARNWLGDGASPPPDERPAVTQTWSEGGGKPHNNMPPFIALLYCQKQ